MHLEATWNMIPKNHRTPCENAWGHSAFPRSNLLSVTGGPCWRWKRDQLLPDQIEMVTFYASNEPVTKFCGV